MRHIPLADFLARLGHEPVRRSGNELCKELGGGRSAYQCIKAGNRVGEGIVKAIYNKFGEKVLTEVVDMEEESISGLKSKSIVIAGKLY